MLSLVWYDRGMEHLHFDEFKNGEEITMDKLAVMIGKGFEHVDSRFDEVEQRFEKVENEAQGLKKEMQEGFAKISTQLDTLRDEVVHRNEFDDALARIKYIERKLGIESGVA